MSTPAFLITVGALLVIAFVWEFACGVVRFLSREDVQMMDF